MTRHESYDTHVYVEGRDRPLPVGMYTDEHSQVCSIRFSNSFTLNVVDPLMLETLIRELQAFADAAHELHYGPKPSWQRVEAIGEEMARLQQKLEDCGVGMNEFMEEELNEPPADEHTDAYYDYTKWGRATTEEEINAARARYLREEEVDDAPEPSKVERLMQGTVSAPQIDPMNDPMNW